MFNQRIIFEGAVVAASVYCGIKAISATVQARKAASIALEIIENHEATQQVHDARIEYLYNLIQTHEIDLDEFDMIIINNLLPTKKA